MSDSPSVCPACGARLRPDALACDLCGHDSALPPDESLLDDEAPDGERPEYDLAETPPAGLPHGDGAGVPRPGAFCNACGAPNPPAARFCNACGAAMHPVATLPTPAPSRPERPAAPGLDAPTGQRLWLMVGGAVLLVAGLFALVTLRHPAPTPREAQEGARGQMAAPGAAAPSSTAPSSEGLAPTGELAVLTPAQTRTLDSLRRAVDALAGTARTDKQRELARMQYAFGRPDEAGTTMEAVAAASNATADWRQAGNFLYQWMETLGEDERGPVATRVIAAFDAVLAKEDGDLDSRTRLGWAAQYAGDNPMRAVIETQAVLQRDSNHVGANYNRAFLLLKIGRADQALAQLRKVERLAGAGSPLAQQAAQLAAEIERQRGAPSR